MPRLILASQSPRRIDLLTQAGYRFKVVPADVEEAFDPSLRPPDLTCANAEIKARAVARFHPDDVILGADTLVYLGDHPLGKPTDLDEAAHMLTQLGGRTHQVCTGVDLIAPHGEVEDRFHVITQVTFRELTRAQIEEYLGKINPLDKAGAYAAQEHGSLVIDRVEGSWTNVVGLPMDETRSHLEALGLRPEGP